MNSISISDAILFLIPNSEFRIVENDLSTLEFFSPVGQKHPTEAEVAAAIETLKTANAQKIAEKAADKAALLEKLGITEDEARLLLGGN
jgi:hypothetical protein